MVTLRGGRSFVAGMKGRWSFVVGRMMLHDPMAVTVAVRIIPHHTMYPPVAGVASLTEQTKAQFGRLGSEKAEYPRQDLKPLVKGNHGYKGPVPIWFEVRDKQTLMPLGEHAAHWSSYVGEVIRGVPLYHPSWLKVPKERKATLIADIGTQFDLKPHVESPDWTEIHAGIQQHLQKTYNTNKAAFKAQHWVIDPTIGTYNVEKIRWARPQDITTEEWDKYIQFWNDPRNIARAAQNQQNRAKSTAYLDRDPGRLLAIEMRWQSSTTQEYPSLIDTFFVAHTVNREFLRDEDRRIYEEMRRLEATGTYNDDEINRLTRGGKQRRHIIGVGRVLPARATASPSTPAHESTLNSLHKKVDFMTSLFKRDSKYSDMFSQFDSGSASGSGGCGDDEESADNQDDEDEDGDGDS
uniref:F-box domain, leucine-rich repeat domain, L domain-like protein n=1 Tax=Tanacetum cinerariifolium TaxID=118510 RepID=A0A6L2MZT3_TANCI|nr:F-box domain, leucine-rich repeat domain, L domain-like protein [Tanacetum cinerariifolium]